LTSSFSSGNLVDVKIGRDQLGRPELAEAAGLARRAAEAADTAGRPLAAANADLFL
jgi:hypothetical protein